MHSWLKNAQKQMNAPKVSVIETLRKKTGNYAEGRSRSVLHASDITKTDFCPRNEAFQDMNNVTHGKGGYVSAALQVTYDVGSMTEKLIVEKWGGDAIVGNWRCRFCGQSRTMQKKPKDQCKTGNMCDWEYMQWPAVSKEYDVSGAVDSLWDLGTPLLMMVELKIMAPDEFASIIAPLPEHRIRTNLYLKLVADSDSVYKDKINLLEARVLYTSRAYGKANPGHNGEILPWKEFVVERNDKDLERVLTKAKQLKVFRQTGAMPSGICATALDKVAKKCNSCEVCFSGMYPAAQESLL